MADRSAIDTLVGKLESDIPDIRDRALSNLFTKFTSKLITPADVVATYNEIPGVVLNWINEAQESTSPDLISKAIRILELLSKVK